MIKFYLAVRKRNHVLDQPQPVAAVQLASMQEDPEVTMRIMIGRICLWTRWEKCSEILVKIAQRYAVGLHPPRMEFLPDLGTRLYQGEIWNGRVHPRADVAKRTMKSGLKLLLEGTRGEALVRIIECEFVYSIA